MILTKKQEEGLRITLERYREGEKYSIIGGYAGTGKSTLIKYVIDALCDEYDLDDRDICYTSFTGKACQVLLKKGNRNVKTLHKLLFKTRPLPNGGFSRIPVNSIPYKIVVVDEISMAPKELMDLLFRHDVYVIGCGDPFQLPPIDKDQDNHLLDKPHVFLDEVMRQAEDSPIIRLSMAIRAQKPILYGVDGQVAVISKNQMVDDMLPWADQILVGTNKTRIDLNNKMRDMNGCGDSGPQDGDKVICLRNYWETLSIEEDPLVNGTIGYLNNSSVSFLNLPYFYNIPEPVSLLRCNFVTDSDSTFNMLSLDRKQIMTGTPSIDKKTHYRLARSKYSSRIPLEFTYGYAITCHRAQGSEWDKVLVFEESFPFAREEHARWLYTAVTRASESLILVR